jgi:hypothetical protein
MISGARTHADARFGRGRVPKSPCRRGLILGVAFTKSLQIHTILAEDGCKNMRRLTQVRTRRGRLGLGPAIGPSTANPVLPGQSATPETTPPPPTQRFAARAVSRARHLAQLGLCRSEGSGRCRSRRAHSVSTGAGWDRVSPGRSLRRPGFWSDSRPRIGRPTQLCLSPRCCICGSDEAATAASPATEGAIFGIDGESDAASPGATDGPTSFAAFEPRHAPA